MAFSSSFFWHWRRPLSSQPTIQADQLPLLKLTSTEPSSRLK